MKNGRKSHITPADSIANHLLPTFLKFASFASALNKQTKAQNGHNKKTKKGNKQTEKGKKQWTNKQRQQRNKTPANSIANHLLPTFLKSASFASALNKQTKATNRG